MKIKIFAVLSALAAITIAAPQYHQIEISGTTAAAPASAMFTEFYCLKVCSPKPFKCDDGFVLPLL
jgi:hypothetical protein